MLDEAATLIRHMLDEERTTFNGHHYRVENASCLPRPVQQRLPIWIGGVGEKRTLRLAARHADGWNAAYVAPAEFARLSAVLDHWCQVEGRDPTTLRRGVNLSFHLGLDGQDAERETRRMEQDRGPMATRVREGALMGTPETARATIGAYLDAGATDVNIALRAP